MSTAPVSPAPVASTPPVSTARARLFLAEARRYRIEHLEAVANGSATVLDIVQKAATSEGRALRKISLYDLHSHQPLWGKTRTRGFLSALAARMGFEEDIVLRANIAWLIDVRCGGRRFLAWLDVQQPKSGSPWPGFPFARAEGQQ